jgi:probable HAF family extracellular repeat protein
MRPCRERQSVPATLLLLVSVACACSKSGGTSGGSSGAGAYVAKDLGPGSCSAVDDQGDVLGVDESGNPFLLTAAGKMTALGSLPGMAGTFATALDPTGANIVGFGLTPTSHEAARYSGAGWSVPSELAGKQASLVAINGAGSIAATVQTVAPGASMVPTFHAFLLTGGNLQDLGTVGGASSAAYGLSANGSVVGVSQTSAEDSHAFLYSGTKMSDLGTLGGPSSAAYGVNSAGTVVGVSETSDGEGHAFVYTGGALTDLNLGQAHSDARGISEAGVIAGNWQSAAGDVVPFVRVNGKVTQLVVTGASGKSWMSARVEAISPGGVIVGWGRPGSSDGGLLPTHCVIWRPQ